jgi:hypothetical protein
LQKAPRGPWQTLFIEDDAVFVRSLSKTGKDGDQCAVPMSKFDGVELEDLNAGFDGLADDAKIYAVCPRDPVSR